MEIKSYIELLQHNTDKTVQLSSGIPVSQLTQQPGGSWSILEILEHIYLTDKIICSVVARPSDQYFAHPTIHGDEKLKRMMVDMRNHKANAPMPLKPTGIFSSVTDFKNSFLQQRNELKQALENNSIIPDNRIHKHPLIGEMTVWDWLYFMVYHTQRHLEQIKDRIPYSER